MYVYYTMDKMVVVLRPAVALLFPTVSRTMDGDSEVEVWTTGDHVEVVDNSYARVRWVVTTHVQISQPTSKHKSSST